MTVLKSLSAFAAAAAVSASVSVGWAAGVGTGSSAADQDLPDLGSPATAAVSLDDEYRAGLGWFSSMRQTGVVLEDPEVEDYIQEIGHSLSSHAEEGQHRFYYFVVKDPVVNAFAMPGGFVAIDSGLILATRNENELAGVMAHETAHVTQRHLVRQLIDQSHAGLISTAAMLAAILLGATAGRGDPGAMEGAILATQGAAIQHQINYTRASEFEADRIGIGTMASAGYDPLGMASFFDYMSHSGPEPTRINAIQFLIDHPIFSDRVAEAHNRAEQIGRIRHSDSLGYKLMRERLRSLVGNPQIAREYYANLAKNGAGLSIEERYGKDIADINTRNAAAAIPDLQALVRDNSKVTQFYGALGQAYLANGQLKESQAVLEQALNLFPRNVPVTIRMAETLMHTGNNKRAQLILDDLFNTVEPTPAQAKLIAKAANAAGNIADSYYYMADFYLMSGDLRMASNQLQLGLELQGLNPIQRARFSALLEEVRAAMPKDRKNTVADDNGGGNGGGGNGRH
jgi:beta-barrel assembly-enhancing protease